MRNLQQFDSDDYRLTLGVVERRAAEYLSFAIKPNLPEFLKYLKERKEKARNIKPKG
jgi:hypothetical protein